MRPMKLKPKVYKELKEKGEATTLRSPCAQPKELVGEERLCFYEPQFQIREYIIAKVVTREVVKFSYHVKSEIRLKLRRIGGVHTV